MIRGDATTTRRASEYRKRAAKLTEEAQRVRDADELVRGYDGRGRPEH